MPNNSTTPETALVSEFLKNLQREVPPFIQALETTLAKTYNLDVSSYDADHVCWRTETMEEYTTLVNALQNSNDGDDVCKLLVESEIGGRPIATFWLHHGILVPSLKQQSSQSSSEVDACTSNQSRVIHVIEIPAPKQGSFYPRGLEHVEFVIGQNNSNHEPKYPSPVNNEEHHQAVFDAFMKQYPNVDWDTRAKTKAINPDISLKLQVDWNSSEQQSTTIKRQCSVKFHLVPLEKVIEYEITTKAAI